MITRSRPGPQFVPSGYALPRTANRNQMPGCPKPSGQRAGTGGSGVLGPLAQAPRYKWHESDLAVDKPPSLPGRANNRQTTVSGQRNARSVD